MGLTLHYTYGDPTLTADRAETLVRDWHAWIRANGFPDGGEPIYDGFDEDHGGGLVPGLRFLPAPSRDPGEAPDPEAAALADKVAALAEDVPGFSIQTVSDSDFVGLKPRACWFFWTHADGAEPFLIGLARYPATVTAPGGDTVDTHLGDGWHWQGFCKTQYSSDPRVRSGRSRGRRSEGSGDGTASGCIDDATASPASPSLPTTEPPGSLASRDLTDSIPCGGDDHFIRVHTGFVACLDRVARDVAQMEIADESGYADHRSEAKLRAEIRRWNAVIAAFAGRIKDAGLDTDAPILKRPDFEHLEAEGDAALRKGRTDHDSDA